MNKAWLSTGVSANGFDWHGPADPTARPALVDPEQKMKQIWFLERALAVSHSVARVVFPAGQGYASCFLVGPNLILTNHHVFASTADTQGVEIEFNYRLLHNGDLTDPDVYTCDPATFITDEALDFTLVALTQNAKVDYLRLRHGQQAQSGIHVSIIQHPNGDPLQVAMRDNSLVYHDNDLIEYITNTDYGSSGSPVFNDNWEVIGLHSQRVRDPSITSDTVWYRNRGTKIDAILRNSQVNELIPAV